MLSVEEIIKKYSLPQSKIEEITKTILKVLTYNKTPSENPLAVIVGGQPGSGKTALISYTKQFSAFRNFIAIDNDFFRSFHPQADEIRQNHPSLFTQATDQLGMGITESVINYCLENKFDIILHQTLKNNRIGDDAICSLKENGYTVGVRVFAVPFYESSMSQIERYLGQAEKLGYCRFATQEGHLKAYLGLPNTVDYLEKNGFYDFIQVFKRSDDISLPTCVYTSFNPSTKQQTISTLTDCENAPLENNKNGFRSAKEAVLKTRYTTAIETKSIIQTRIDEAQSNPYNNPEIQNRIDELNSSLVLVNQDEKVEEQIANIKNTPSFSACEDLPQYLQGYESVFSSPVTTAKIPRVTNKDDIQILPDTPQSPT
ncbi:MAG: zeta toxin family protein [Clostridia bacterium]|nr:zeta toxin family protein [Clostridia bacterium]